MKTEIKSIWTGETLFACDAVGDTDAQRLRNAVIAAVEQGADLRCANLYGANLYGADLYRADLRGASLRGASLSDANLYGVINFRHIKTLQVDSYMVAYTADTMQIGCQTHPINRWWSFDDAQITAMDDDALEWWRVWKPILQQIIAASPAEPTAQQQPQSEAA